LSTSSGKAGWPSWFILLFTLQEDGGFAETEKTAAFLE
jgi:hypothetical protein